MNARDDHTAPQADLGSTGYKFTTTKAEYFEYLSRLNKQGWYEASTIDYALHKRTVEIKQDAEKGDFKVSRGAPTIAQILDVDLDRSLRVMGELHLADINSGSARQVKHRAQVVDDFLSQLHVCKPEVHTRIILLGLPAAQPSDNSSDLAAVELLHSHILGVELKMNAFEVASFCQYQYLDRNDDRLAFLSRPTTKPLQASFGIMGEESGGCVVSWLGKRKAGDYLPFTVVIRVSESWLLPNHEDEPDGRYWSSSKYGICDPPPPRLRTSLRGADLPSERDTPMCFTYSIMTALEQGGDELEADIPRAHWLSAILQCEYSRLFRDYVKACEEWKTIQDRDRHEDKVKLWKFLSRLGAALQSACDQENSLFKDVPDLVRTDVGCILSRLDRLQSCILRTTSEVVISAEADIKFKSLEMSQMSINESKSGIALTFLAYTFIPLNLASSIFGMNIQEINATGLSIWVFAITALTLLSLSMLAWGSWRLYINRHAYRQLRRRFWTWQHEKLRPLREYLGTVIDFLECRIRHTIGREQPEAIWG